MKHVTLIATGGTIASSARTRGAAVTAGLSGETLLAGLHTPPAGITVTVENFEAAGSYALDLATIHRLCARIDAVLADPAVDGVVVTHGTDTMEESAFLAWLLVRSEKPVVFTGAQRHAGQPDTDGPRNIADALSAAASPLLGGLGAVILFEGDIHGARHVTKAHTARVDTFRSVGQGKLGEVDGGTVHLYTRPAAPRRPLAVPRLDPEVELITLGLGSTPRLMALAGDHGASAIVLSAFGRGNAPKGFAAETARLLARGLPVVVASRCHEGRTAAIYGGDSGGVTLAEAGAIPAGDLSAVKARLLLAALLGAGLTGTPLREAFAGYA
ncbi:asparaginase [Pseudooceanicola sp. CBS1P-1]|uniref:Asparaginase n=1 Tax=Pseudooceanicola albus TaxID=2692189 RepID=A0A6L7G535_9RHOB|nr:MULTISPECIES: asparaginase [Pseudooceanicola]MBT9386108.1 asparaginase [Pseudooceanicola endophyticus]MXN19474.1 asparaginase [Pseudooceanicola albus]